MVVHSRGNAVAKWLVGLRGRKQRDRSGLYVLEGAQPVALAARARADIRALVVSESMAGRWEVQALADTLAGTRCDLVVLSDALFAGVLPRARGAGVAAVVRQQWVALDDVAITPSSAWLALECTEHPGTIGTVLRTADAAGCAGAILVGHSADPYDPVAVRASLGAVLTQQLARATPEGFAKWRRRLDCFVVGASPTGSGEFRSVAYDGPLLLLFGGERSGISPELSALCDTVVRIPMLGQIDSLHLSVASALLMYEVAYQRERQSDPRGADGSLRSPALLAAQTHEERRGARGNQLAGETVVGKLAARRK